LKSEAAALQLENLSPKADASQSSRLDENTMVRRVEEMVVQRVRSFFAPAAVTQAQFAETQATLREFSRNYAASSVPIGKRGHKYVCSTPQIHFKLQKCATGSPTSRKTVYF
jgi:hypothetical protein